MNLPQQRERVTVDGLGNVGVGKYTETVEKSGKSGIMNVRFNTVDDPMREVTGVGLKSNPKEIKSIIDDVTSSGSEIEYRKNTMCYEPGLRKGTPGRIVIDPEASYSAWLHEYTHFSDDRKDGYWGMRVLKDSEKCIAREERAYDVEIQLATNANRPDIVERLEKLKKAEVKKYEVCPENS